MSTRTIRMTRALEEDLKRIAAEHSAADPRRTWTVAQVITVALEHFVCEVDARLIGPNRDVNKSLTAIFRAAHKPAAEVKP